MAPEVSKTSMLLGLSHSLEIFSHGSVHVVRDELSEETVLGVFLSVKEPLWDIIIGGSSNDVTNLLDVLFGEFTSSLVGVDTSNLEGKESKSSTNTSDLSETERSLLLTVQVGVLHTENMLEVVRILEY